MNPLTSPTSKATSQSESSEDSSRKRLNRTKQGIGYNGKPDNATLLAKHPSLQSLLSSQTDSTEEASKKSSRKALKGRLSKSGSDTQFPTEDIISSLKRHDKKVVEEQTEQQFWKQIAGTVIKCPSVTLVEELPKFRRLDLLRMIRFINVKEEKFIVALLKQYLLSQSPIVDEVIDSLVEERKHIDKDMHPAYDSAINSLLTADQSALYFDGINQTSNPTSKSYNIQLTNVDRTLIQSRNPLTLLLKYRRAAQNEGVAMTITKSVALSGNPDIFIPYISEVFNLVLSSEHDFSEIREGIKIFLQEIRPLYLGDGAKIYEVIKRLNDTLQDLISSGKEKSVGPIDRLTQSIIYEDNLTSVVICLFEDMVSSVKRGEKDLEFLVAQHQALEDINLKLDEKTRKYNLKTLDGVVVRNLRTDQIFEYATAVFKSIPDDSLAKQWLLGFVKTFQDETSFQPVIELAIQHEVSDPDTQAPKSASPLREDRMGALLVAEALKLSTHDYSLHLFKKMLEILGKSEKRALKLWYHENNIRSSGRQELLDPKVLAKNEERFFNESTLIMGELLSKMKISPITVQILGSVRKHFKLREEEPYSLQEIWDILSNLWLLRGINSNLISFINEIESPYENRLHDPVLGAMTQFINHVMLKISVPDCWNNLPEGHPRRKFHLIYHKQIVKMFKEAVRASDEESEV